MALENLIHFDVEFVAFGRQELEGYFATCPSMDSVEYRSRKFLPVVAGSSCWMLAGHSNYLQVDCSSWCSIGSGSYSNRSSKQSTVMFLAKILSLFFELVRVGRPGIGGGGAATSCCAHDGGSGKSCCSSACCGCC